MANSWMAHVKKTMKSESGKKKSMGKKWFTHVLRTAKKSYKGGGTTVASTAAPATGGKRNKTARKSRGRKH